MLKYRCSQFAVCKIWIWGEGPDKTIPVWFTKLCTLLGYISRLFISISIIISYRLQQYKLNQWSNGIWRSLCLVVIIWRKPCTVLFGLSLPKLHCKIVSVVTTMHILTCVDDVADSALFYIYYHIIFWSRYLSHMKGGWGWGRYIYAFFQIETISTKTRLILLYHRSLLPWEHAISK